MRARALLPRRVVTALAVTSLAVALPLAGAGAAGAATTSHATRHHHHQSAALRGATSVTTAPGLATALLRAGVLPLPVRPSTRVGIASLAPLELTYRFPVTGGNPDLATATGDVLHSGGIAFVSRHASLEIGRFDIDLAAGKVFARQVNYASARIPVLDLGLADLKVSTSHGATVLSGISLTLDPAAANALNATFGLSLPTDGSLVFGSARVVLR